MTTTKPRTTRTKRQPKSKEAEPEPNWKKVGGDEIPRRKNSNGTWGGPYIIPPGAQHIPGRHQCSTCKRMVKTDRQFPRKGSCKCLYYKRTTTFIDVLQDEYLLKQWGKRNVAWGMAQRPDLVLHATTCKPDTDKSQSLEDKTELNNIAAEADSTAQSMKGARIGTSLHKLTHQMDRGETLGFVPDPYPADLKAYDEEMKRLGVQWVSVESFRVYDGWVDPECEHKWGHCQCMGVGGTVDRIGWYMGRLRIFDIKTGSDYNKVGHAMQLTMYAKMIPYLFPGDQRTTDVGEIDLNVGYIIKLPEGQGHCEIVPMDLQKGWRACQVAKTVWDMRDMDVVIDRDVYGEYSEHAGRAGSIKECKLLWRNAKEQGFLDRQLKAILTTRANELTAQGITQ